jgi:hypothetical protein
MYVQQAARQSTSHAVLDKGEIMKNDRIKLSLDDLKVQSFVTTLTTEQELTVRGGATVGIRCSSDSPNCGSGEDSVTMCNSLVICDTHWACTTGIRCV